VDPDLVIRFSYFYDGVTKGFVDLLIGLPVSVFVHRIQRKIVKERPNGLITKAMIKILNVLHRKKNRMAILLFKVI